MSEVNLNSLAVGKKCKVIKVSAETKIRRRLMDMGIVPGTEMIIHGKAPMGDPIEVIVRGYHLTLRKNEAQEVIVANL